MSITDVWFYTEFSLRDLNEKIGAKLEYVDGENYWEWSISSLEGVKMDITRTHTKPAAKTPTIIFLVGNAAFEESFLELLIKRLKAISISPVYLGQRKYLHGNEFEFLVEREEK